MSRISRDLPSSAHNGPLANNSTYLSEMQSLRNANAVSSRKTPSIAVIGAGMSGLRCSEVLARNGIKVTLFEARNRIGGRVHQMTVGSHLVDMGPNWIHGTNGNPMMRLAEQTGTVVMSPDEERQALFDRHGTRRPDAEGTEHAGRVWEMIVDAFKYSDDHSAEIDPRTSLYQYFQSKLDTEKGLDRRKRDDILQEAQMWGPFVGDSVETQSLKFFFLEECIDGENVFVANTYKHILANVEQAVAARDNIDIRLATPVVHFDVNPANKDNGQNKQIAVTTSTGETSSFNNVIITCPLGWLKQNHIKAFTPALPARLTAAISNITYGRLEKLYVTFPSAFWLKAGKDDVEDVSSHPIFTHFHDPLYIRHPATEAWNQSVVSLAHLPPPHAHPTLLFYMYGACGTHCVDLVESLQPHSSEYNAVLKDFALPFYSLLPNFQQGSPECEPVAFLMTKWQADDFAGNGSYSNFKIGLEKGDEDIECMRDAGGLTEKGLWLAGEHTAPFIALGTTTGAWWSGEAVAKRICKKYGIETELDDEDEVEMLRTQSANGKGKKKELVKEKPDGANLSGLAI